MFAWFDRKRRARAKALETYLSHFDAGELAYLKNITLIGLAPSMLGRKDPFVSVDISTYLQGEWLAATGQIESSSAIKAKARARYRLKLASASTPGKIRTIETYLQNITPHKLDEPELDDSARERLGAHWIVLMRLYVDPANASSLPELEELGEGLNWLPT